MQTREEAKAELASVFEMIATEYGEKGLAHAPAFSLPILTLGQRVAAPSAIRELLQAVFAMY